MAKTPREAQKEFEMDLKNFTDKYLPEQQTLFVRKISMDLLADITLRSPVDTGRFRGAWVVGVNSPNTSEPNTPDKVGIATITRGVSEIGSVRAGDKVNISNNVEYAVALEYGHSKKAPQGVVAVAINRIMAKLQQSKNKSVEDM